jgi:hypothetical protein
MPCLRWNGRRRKGQEVRTPRRSRCCEGNDGEATEGQGDQSCSVPLAEKEKAEVISHLGSPS